MDLMLPIGYLSDYGINLLYNPLWSPDGQSVVADFDMISIPSVIWNTKTLEMRRSPFSDMSSWAFYESQLAIATNNASSPLEVWNIDTEEKIAEYDIEVSHVTWSPNGDYLAVASPHQIHLCEFAWSEIN